MTQFPKLLIIGHGRHGKDTVADMIAKKFNVKFQASSEFLAERLMFPALKTKYNYSSTKECFDDRHNHRAEWYDLICDYCSSDKAKLGREIFTENHIYCGLRNKAEFHAMRNEGVFDYCIWVDRSDHLPAEDRSSMSLEIWMADFVIDNNYSLADLETEVDRLMTRLVTRPALNRLASR